MPDRRPARSPKVSVLMPSFNYKRYLPEAVTSVLEQTYQDLELLVVDDGSTDGSFEFLKEIEKKFPEKVRVLTHPGHRNLGLAATYGEALKHARGKVVAFLESDDVWHPQNLEKKIRVFEKHPEVGVVYSRYRPFGWARGVIYWKIYEAANAAGIPMGRPVDLFSIFLKRNSVASFSHFIVRRDLLDGIPALKTMQSNNDWWMLAHLSARTLFYGVPEFLCYWRIHPKSFGFGRVDKKALWKLRGFFSRLYESLSGLGTDRRRQLSGGLLFLRKLRNKEWAVLLQTFLYPVQLSRFLVYIGLRNLLFST